MTTATTWAVALELHATAAEADDVSWPNVRALALTAEDLGFDAVVLPDHLSYRAGGPGDYARDDAAVGVRESMTTAAAVAAVTTRIGVAHSVINTPYRSPAMVAHLAASLAEIAGGRYELGVGSGNSADYDQLGVDSSQRVARLEESLSLLAGLLREGHADSSAGFWRAQDAELVLRPATPVRLVVAAGGPRSMRAAARWADRWNGFVPADPEAAAARALVRDLDDACAAVGRDPQTLGRTVDIVVDPLDAQGARSRSADALAALAELGLDQVRCYNVSASSPSSRVEALHALAELTSAL